MTEWQKRCKQYKYTIHACIEGSSAEEIVNGEGEEIGSDRHKYSKKSGFIQIPGEVNALDYRSVMQNCDLYRVRIFRRNTV